MISNLFEPIIPCRLLEYVCETFLYLPSIIEWFTGLIVIEEVHVISLRRFKCIGFYTNFAFDLQEIPQDLIREGHSKTEFLIERNDPDGADGTNDEPEIWGSVIGRSGKDVILPKFYFGTSLMCKSFLSVLKVQLPYDRYQNWKKVYCVLAQSKLKYLFRIMMSLRGVEWVHCLFVFPLVLRKM